MKIESIIRRKGGTKVHLEDENGRNVKYHFVPDETLPDEPHICDVQNEDHIERLLSITDGYREVLSPEEQKKADAAARKKVPGKSQIKQPQEPKRASVGPDDIRALNAHDLKARIGTFKIEDLSAALAVELASGNRREDWIDVVRGQIGALE